MARVNSVQFFLIRRDLRLIMNGEGANYPTLWAEAHGYE